jgi:hypothetical protein
MTKSGGTLISVRFNGLRSLPLRGIGFWLWPGDEEEDQGVECHDEENQTPEQVLAAFRGSGRTKGWIYVWAQAWHRWAERQPIRPRSGVWSGSAIEGSAATAVKAYPVVPSLQFRHPDAFAIPTRLDVRADLFAERPGVIDGFKGQVGGGFIIGGKDDVAR